MGSLTLRNLSCGWVSNIPNRPCIWASSENFMWKVVQTTTTAGLESLPQRSQWCSRKGTLRFAKEASTCFCKSSRERNFGFPRTDLSVMKVFFYWITSIDTYTCIHIKSCRGARILLIDPYMNPHHMGNRPPVVGCYLRPASSFSPSRWHQIPARKTG